MTETSHHDDVLKTLAEQMEDVGFPVILCDTDLRVLYRNKFVRENVRILDLPGSFTTLISQEQAEEFRERLLRGENIRLGNIIATLLDTFISISPLKHNGAVVGAIVTMNLTDANISSTSVLAHNSSAIFSANFRQPLTDIFSALSVINRNLQDQEDRPLDAYLQTITRASYRMLRNTVNVIHRMSAFASYKKNTEVVDIWERIAEVLEASAIVLRPADIQLSYSLPEEEALVRCDFSSVTVALMNIISNACKHGSADGKVSVTGKVVGNSAMVTVMDRGQGMTQEFANRIFIPYAARAINTLPYDGLGMGLTVAKQLIQEAGGTIAVESTPGQWTKVIFTLPTVQDEEPTPRLTMESGSASYLRDRFSPVYVGLCDIAPPPDQ